MKSKNKKKRTSSLSVPKKDFYAVYQPIIDVGSKHVIGYESLTRSGGQAPAGLLRSAYYGGKIINFDFKCLRTGAKILSKLNGNKLLFLNVEPITFGHAFVKGGRGESFLKEHRKHSKQIVFELTEGVKTTDLGFIEKGADFIRSKGYRFALDDLSDVSAKTFKLISMSPSFIKIDISLINGISKNTLNQEIVHQMVDLARINDSRLIAEGIEKLEDLEFVSKMGIHYAQGYYLSKPKRKLVTRIPFL